MNTLADNALFEAFICGRSHMTSVDVERAHRDLGWASVTPSNAPVPNAPEPNAPVQNAPVPNPPASEPAESPAAAADPVLQQTLDELDPELAAMFKTAQSTGGSPLPTTGPPKTEDSEPEDLLIELIED
jgi:hypothetical protein